MQIGAQFFTVRNQCQTLDDFALTLKKVADIGYKTVQISGTCPYEAQWLREQLDKNGLQCVLTHIPVPRLVGETAQVIADHHVFGCENIGLGWYAFNEEKEEESYAHFMNTFPKVAQDIRAGGRYFMYHNHDQEFKRAPGGGSQIILEKLAQEIPAEVMGFTLDTFWVQAGGGDPAQLRVGSQIVFDMLVGDQTAPQVQHKLVRPGRFGDAAVQGEIPEGFLGAVIFAVGQLHADILLAVNDRNGQMDAAKKAQQLSFPGVPVLIDHQFVAIAAELWRQGFQQAEVPAVGTAQQRAGGDQNLLHAIILSRCGRECL